MIRRPPRSTLFPLHDALPIVTGEDIVVHFKNADGTIDFTPAGLHVDGPLLIDEPIFAADFAYPQGQVAGTQTAKLTDRKSTRLNSSHANISYAAFCLRIPSSV